MKIKWKPLVICLVIPLVVGGVAGYLSMDSMKTFETLNKPPLSPPGWLFPVVWTVLYLLMGLASYLIVTSDAPKQSIQRALTVYIVQLIVNFFWTLIFFNAGLYLFAFIWLVLLFVLITVTILLFYRISKPAAYLLLPYWLWVAFAGYLNLGIYLLN